MCHELAFVFLPRCGSGGLVLASPSTALAGRMGWGRRLQKEVLEGQQAGGPGLLAAYFFSEPYAHCRDEGSPLATTVFRQQKGHITLW